MRRTMTAALCLSLLLGFGITEGQAGATASVPTMTAQERQWAGTVLAMVNKERAANHLASVASDSDLVASAFAHDVVMAKDESLSHQLPGEPTPDRRMVAAGYTPLILWGENVGWNGNSSVYGVDQMETTMYNEKAPYDGHRENILNPKLKCIGIAVYIDPVQYRVWLTEDFATK